MGESKITAKTSSKWGQIISALWIAGWCAFTFITGCSIPIGDIVFSGLAIAASFIPVYFNLIMDKIKEIKLGAV
jgi:hypothetical protein